MRLYIIEIFVVAFMVLAPFLLQAKQQLQEMGGDPAGRLMKRVVYLIALMIPTYGLADFVSEQFFGKKLPPIHSFFDNTDAYRDTADDTSRAQAELLVLTSAEVCGRALSGERNGWAPSRDAERFVTRAQDQGDNVDSCREKLGLRTLKEEETQKEINRIRSLTDLSVCQNSVDEHQLAISNAGNKPLYVAEALRRELSPEICARLGRGVVDSDLPQVGMGLKNPSKYVDPRSGLPISVVSNASLPYANMRSGPGREFTLLSKLPNGIEVMIYGPALSASGSQWCRVATGDGKKGFISAEFLSDSCELTTQQLNLLQAKSRAEADEAAKLGHDFLTIIGNISKR